MSDNKGFYLIYNPQRPHQPPKVRHHNYDAALLEAKRLARTNPGEVFYVMGSLQQVHAETTVVNQCMPDDGPFDRIPF